MTVPGLMERAVIGGWPDLLDAEEREARSWLSGYLKQIIEVDIPSFIGRRDPRTLGRVLASLARFVAQSPATRTVAADAGGERGPVAPATIYSHLDALERLQLLDNSEARQPHMRSRARLRMAATRYFVDPSIGTAALGIGSSDLLNDLEAAGYYFEALVVRDLRIFAQRLGGRVDTWRDEYGNEVDALITLPGGRWAAVEIKMSQREVDKAAAGLLNFVQRVDSGKQGEPVALIVITATGSAGRRSDGVHVAPITALAP
ncbi:ATP-binding protein [Leucobacter sp. GX24907]